MDSRRAAPTAGIAASLLFVALLAVPYVVIEEASAVGTYYDAGPLTPWAAGLMALVAVIVFAAGREDRTDPDTAAGAAVGLGTVVLIVTALWAVTVPADVPLQLTTDEPLVGPLTTATVIEYHRWVAAVVSGLPVVAAAWYARALRLF
jgi:hypothetical protein